MKKKPLLIDTSALRPAVGMSTAAHEDHFDQVVGASPVVTSIYIRKEFIDRWFSDFVRVAAAIRLYGSVSQALKHLDQSFKPRDVKGVVAVIAEVLEERGAMSNSAAACEEIASIAVQILEYFDAKFSKRTNNRCGCEIGGKELMPDYDNILDSLARFLEEFRTEITDCKVNDFMKLNSPHGYLNKFLAHKDAAVQISVVNLEKIRSKGKTIACKNCKTIGDAVIAADQPPSTVLLHLDGSFNSLCDTLNKDHTQIKSITAAS